MGNSSDFFRAYQPLFEEKEDGKKGKKPEWLTKVEKDAEEKEDKKPKNVEETSANFFRKYSDIIKEAEEDDEDPDVAAADKVKGKDKQTQKDAEKKLPPWLKKGFDKKEKSDEDKGAKKAKADKDL